MVRIDIVWSITSEKGLGLFASLFVMEGISALRFHRTRSRLMFKGRQATIVPILANSKHATGHQRGEGGSILLRGKFDFAERSFIQPKDGGRR